MQHKQARKGFACVLLTQSFDSMHWGWGAEFLIVVSAFPHMKGLSPLL